MKINITKATTVADLSEAFQKKFENLTLRCFHLNKEGTNADSSHVRLDRRITSEEKLASYMNKTKFPINVVFVETMSVTDFEQYMQAALGMEVQVFRRSGKVWLQTIDTDDWTLTEQNSAGHSDYKTPELKNQYSD